MSHVRLVVIEQTAGRLVIGRCPSDFEHLEQTPESRANTCDVSRTWLRASTARKMLTDEAIDRGVVERPISDPAAEVLDCEHVLVKRARLVSTSTEVPDVVLKDGSEWI